MTAGSLYACSTMGSRFSNAKSLCRNLNLVGRDHLGYQARPRCRFRSSPETVLGARFPARDRMSTENQPIVPSLPAAWPTEHRPRDLSDRRAITCPPFPSCGGKLNASSTYALCQERSCASANSEASHLHRRGIGIARGPASAFGHVMPAHAGDRGAVRHSCFSILRIVARLGSQCSSERDQNWSFGTN